MRLRYAMTAALLLTAVQVPYAAAETTCGGLAATIEGTDGDDDLLGTTGPDVIAALDGDDSIVGRGGEDVICDGPGSDAIDGGSGNDVFYQGEKGDVLEGGKGSDLVSYIEHEAKVILNLKDGYAEVSGNGGDQLHGIESAAGTAWDDALVGDHGPNVLIGRGGADDLLGLRGDDSIYGKSGRDLLRGGMGNDRCETRHADRVRVNCERTTG